MTTQNNAEASGKKLPDFLYKEITYQIRGACFEVWKSFGGAFKESVVQRALIQALKQKNLQVENQKRLDLYFGNERVGTYVPDLVINEAVLIELKAKPFLTKEDERQFWRYLKGSPYKLGLLINFGSKELEIRRRIYDKARYQRKSA